MYLGHHMAQLSQLVLFPLEKNYFKQKAVAPTAPESRLEQPGAARPLLTLSLPRRSWGASWGGMEQGEPPHSFLETAKSPQYPRA